MIYLRQFGWYVVEPEFEFIEDSSYLPAMLSHSICWFPQKTGDPWLHILIYELQSRLGVWEGVWLSSTVG